MTYQSVLLSISAFPVAVLSQALTRVLAMTSKGTSPRWLRFLLVMFSMIAMALLIAKNA